MTTPPTNTTFHRLRRFNPIVVVLPTLFFYCACTSQQLHTIPKIPIESIPGHSTVLQDTAPKEEIRLVPAEAYIRTYLKLFGGLAPLEVQKKARGTQGSALFDTWDDYIAALGLPDYRNDLPRSTQTNAIMIATFERLGIALCDRAIEHDLRPANKIPVPLEQRLLFAFETPQDLNLNQFTERFDRLHRTFLGYPVSLATTPRAQNFYQLYTQTITRHQTNSSIKTSFTPLESAWAVVCYGLIRHPEFQFY